MTLNLTATTTEEKVLKEYLEQNASEALAEKINNGVPVEKDGKNLMSRKTLAGFMKHATEEARKQAAKGATSACLHSDIVFGWAIHYFEENAIEGEIFNVDGTPYKKIITPKTKDEKKAPAPKPKAPTATPGTKPGTTEQKKAKILPTPKPNLPKPTEAYRSQPKPTEPLQKLAKSKSTDTDQISIFDLF